jgi:Outer membrane protein beta-barrel domain
MKKTVIHVLTAVTIFLAGRNGYAQYEDQKKFEVGAQFSVLGINDPRGLNDIFPRTELGMGGRLSYNLNRHFALEAEVNFFPRDYRKVRSNFTGGRMTEGLFGLKAGLRKNKVGIFGKVRPGFESSGRAEIARFPNGNGPDRQNPFGFEDMRATQFALDVGGVFELYPSRRTIARFDFGDTIVRYPGIPFTQIPQGTIVVKSLYSNKLQFSAGLGFRF